MLNGFYKLSSAQNCSLFTAILPLNQEITLFKLALNKINNCKSDTVDGSIPHCTF